MKARIFGMLALFLVALPMVAECVAIKDKDLYISDRYRSSAVYGEHLILANSFGLVFRDKRSIDPTPLHMEPLEGDITSVSIEGRYVFAMARNLGVFLLEYGDSGFPIVRDYQAIPGIASMVTNGSYMFSRESLAGVGKIRIWRIVDGSFVHHNQISGNFLEIAANDSLVFAREKTGRVEAFAYVNAPIEQIPNVVVDGQEIFYGLEMMGNRLILDSLDGIYWADVSLQSGLSNSGLVARNAGTNYILGFATSDSQLFLRYNNRIEIRSAQGDSFTPAGSIPQVFSDIGNTILEPGEDFLFMLNRALQERTWSLAAYDLNNANPTESLRLAAVGEEIVDGVSFKGSTYLAVNRDLLLADSLLGSGALESLPVALTMDGNIQRVLASENLLYILSTVPGGNAKVTIYRQTEGGIFDSVYETDIDGSLLHLSQSGSHLLYVTLNRETEDVYQANVLTENEGVFSLLSTSSSVSFGLSSPFGNIQLGDNGLTYIMPNGDVVYRPQPDVADQIILDLPRSLNPTQVLAMRDHLWVGTPTGLHLFKLEVDGQLNEVGVYPQWRNLAALPNNMIMAQNLTRQSTNPGAIHLLSLGSTGLVTDVVDFTISDGPKFIIELGGDFLLGERAVLSQFRFQCPEQAYYYLIPNLPDLELELPSTLSEGAVVKMTLLNADGDVIGFQDMDKDLIAYFKGQTLSEWFFDYNHQSTPTSFLLTASEPLAPIVSGANADSTEARFSYQVPEAGNGTLYLPHVPPDFWETSAYITRFGGNSSQLFTFDPRGSRLEFEFDDSDLVSLIVNDLEFDPDYPYVSFSSDDLGAELGGFYTYTTTTRSGTAAMPLVQELSNYLVLPYISGVDGNISNWTGMALTNPHNQEAVVQIIVYGTNGGIAGSIPLSLPPRSKMLQGVESWLRDAHGDISDPAWFAVVSDLDIAGIALYGQYNSTRLAGLPLLGRSSSMLTFPGMRSNNEWQTSLRLNHAELTTGTVTFKGYDSAGSVVASVSRELGPRESTGYTLEALFGASAPLVDTVQAQSDDLLLNGFVFREKRGLPTLEAYKALTQ